MSYNKPPKQLHVDTDSGNENELDILKFSRTWMLESISKHSSVKTIMIYYRKGYILQINPKDCQKMKNMNFLEKAEIMETVEIDTLHIMK